jgi:hypothetical protein
MINLSREALNLIGLAVDFIERAGHWILGIMLVFPILPFTP